MNLSQPETDEPKGLADLRRRGEIRDSVSLLGETRRKLTEGDVDHYSSKGGTLRSLRIRTEVVAFAAMALLVAACGGDEGSGGGGSSAGGDASEPIEVSLRLDYLVSGYATPLVAGVEQGFFEERGLDVTVQEGKGSSTTIQTVGNGADTFGLADLGTAALLISDGVPVKSIGAVLQTSPNGLAYLGSDVDITGPEDLEGLNLGMAQGESPLTLLPPVLEQAGVEEDAVNIRLMDTGAKFAALFEGQVDAIGSFSVGSFTAIKGENDDAEIALYSDWGVNTLSAGFITSTSFLEENADAVQAFTEASAESWEWALENPDEAVDLTMENFPEANPDALLAGLTGSEDLLQTDASEGQPFGWAADEDWQQTIDLMQQYGGLEEPLPVEDYYTNEFVE